MSIISSLKPITQQPGRNPAEDAAARQAAETEAAAARAQAEQQTTSAIPYAEQEAAAAATATASASAETVPAARSLNHAILAVTRACAIRSAAQIDIARLRGALRRLVEGVHDEGVARLGGEDIVPDLPALRVVALRRRRRWPRAHALGCTARRLLEQPHAVLELYRRLELWARAVRCASPG